MKLEQEIQQDKFRNEKHKAAVNILFTYGWLMAKFKEIFKEEDITPQQFNVLRILRGQFPNSVNLCLIRERMLDRMSDVSRIIDRLYQKKLVLRETNSTDRRQVDVKISNDGLELLKKMDYYNKDFDDVMKNLSESETKSLNILLDKLRGDF